MTAPLVPKHPDYTEADWREFWQGVRDGQHDPRRTPPVQRPLALEER